LGIILLRLFRKKIFSFWLKTKRNYKRSSTGIFISDLSKRCDCSLNIQLTLHLLEQFTTISRGNLVDVHKIDVIIHDETALAIFDGTAYQILTSTF